MKDCGLVSIIMLSHNSGRFVKETIESVKAQTYQNWELLFVDDNSKDDTIHQMMELKGDDKRINVSLSVYEKGVSYLKNKALKEARGRWIAFLDVGDVWAPDKLEKQMKFMEANSYAFSYTKYGLMDNKSKNRSVIIGGKEHINYTDMQKCCWPCYLTVMCDVSKVGEMYTQEKSLDNNDIGFVSAKRI